MPVVAVLSPAEAGLIHEVVLAGASAYRIQPGPIEPLLSDIRRVATLPQGHRTGPGEFPDGRILTVVSLSGGLGKTGIATRVAALMAKKSSSDQVALVDLNLAGGATDIAFGVQAVRSVAHVLTAAGAVAALLGDFRSSFRLTVVDTASFIDDVLVSSLRAADLVLVVVTPDLVSVRNNLRLVEAAHRFGVPSERMSVVVNGVGGKEAVVAAGEVERVLNLQIIAQLLLLPGMRADCLPGGGPSTVLAREITRRCSFVDLADRCDIEPLRALISAILQAERFGTPISQSLRAQSRDIKMQRRQWVQEQLAKAPVKMLVPMAAFVLPALLVVLLGPAALSFVTGQ